MNRPKRLPTQPLRDYLARFDLTPADVAARCGIADQTVRDVLARDTLPWWRADRLAVGLGVTPHQVWSLEEWEGPSPAARADAAFARLREAVAA